LPIPVAQSDTERRLAGARSVHLISFVRVAGVAPGRTSAAIGFAQEMAAYMKNTYGVELEVLRPIGGNPQRIAWSARHKDLAAVEAVTAKTLADKQYWAMVGKASENFVAGSMRDTIWHTV
jgi:hypothetical protein